MAWGGGLGGVGLVGVCECARTVCGGVCGPFYTRRVCAGQGTLCLVSDVEGRCLAGDQAGLTLLLGAQMVVPAGSLRSCWMGEASFGEWVKARAHACGGQQHTQRVHSRMHADAMLHASARTASVALTAFTSSR